MTAAHAGAFRTHMPAAPTPRAARDPLHQKENQMNTVKAAQNITTSTGKPEIIAPEVRSFFARLRSS